MTSSPDVRGLRRWWHRYLELLVAEVRRPDGTRYLVSINPTGFGECWLPIEIIDLEEGDIPVTV
jgi:hypothetical protein